MSAGPLIFSGLFGLMVGFVVMGFVLARQAYRREHERRIEAERAVASSRIEVAAAQAAAAEARTDTGRAIEQRNFAMDQLRDMRAAFTEQEHRLKNLERVDRNPLYRESLEDKQTEIVQHALRIRLAKEAIDAAWEMVNTKGNSK